MPPRRRRRSPAATGPAVRAPGTRRRARSPAAAAARRPHGACPRCWPRAHRGGPPPRDGMNTTWYASAYRLISGNSRSRSFSVSFLESSSDARLSSRLGPSTQAATTSGPAQAPRPTSSTPATGPSPLRYSADSSVRRPDDLRMTVRGGHGSDCLAPPRLVPRWVVGSAVGTAIRPAADSPRAHHPTARAARR